MYQVWMGIRCLGWVWNFDLNSEWVSNSCSDSTSNSIQMVEIDGEIDGDVLVIRALLVAVEISIVSKYVTNVV